MLIVVGLILIPIVFFMMKRAERITTPKWQRILLNLSLVLIAAVYVALCWIVREEPFAFEDSYSTEYMIYNGEYILDTGLIFLFSPFMWLILIHFVKMLSHAIRVRKNAVIKRNEDFLYYRGDLDKIPPSMVMFTSQLEIDIRKCISATILKLKLTGYIEEKGGGLFFTNKSEANLFASERMVLNFVRGGGFDQKEYREAVEKETLKQKYLTRNRGGVGARILKIAAAVCMPIAVIFFSIWLDNYHFENYHIWPEDDGHAYIALGREEDIERLYEQEVKDLNDYYHREMADGSWDYNYREIRADKLEYSVVRKAMFLTVLGTFSIGFIGVFVLIAIYIITEQVRCFHKNYTRTVKGKILLNKAYALKNYLKNYSLIKDRTEEELVLWEYYLIYAVALDVNVKMKDKIIEKYIKRI